MKQMKLLFLSFLVILVTGQGCNRAVDHSQLIEIVKKEIEAGNLTRAMSSADSLKTLTGNNSKLFLTADSLYEIAYRIRLDFSKTPEETFSAIETKLGRITPMQIAEWERKNWLEGRIIDNKKMYFNRAVSNLALLLNFHEGASGNAPEDEEMSARRIHTTSVIRHSSGNGEPEEPKKMTIVYTITVEKNAVPENEMIRCWLPFPGTHPRQNEIALINTSQPDYIIAPDSALHSTIYMEKRAEKGVPTVFGITFRYKSSAQWFNPDSLRAELYDRNSELFRNYTVEELPHINFSDDVKRIADSICGKDTDPVKNVHNIWRWFKQNIPWTGALEYSIIPRHNRLCMYQQAR